MSMLVIITSNAPGREKEHFERALEIFRKFLGKDHHFTATVRNNLELLANVQGRVEPVSDQN